MKKLVEKDGKFSLEEAVNKKALAKIFPKVLSSMAEGIEESIGWHIDGIIPPEKQAGSLSVEEMKKILYKSVKDSNKILLEIVDYVLEDWGEE